MIDQPFFNVTAVKQRTDLLLKNAAQLGYCMPAFGVHSHEPGALEPVQRSFGPGDIVLVGNCRLRQLHSGPDAKYQRPGGTLDVIYPPAGLDREVSRADPLDIGLDSVDVCPRIGVSKKRAPPVRISRHAHSEQRRAQTSADILEPVANCVFTSKSPARAGDVAHALHPFPDEHSLADAFNRTRDIERGAVVAGVPGGLWPEPQYVPGDLCRLQRLDAIHIIQDMIFGLVGQILDHIYVYVVDNAAQDVERLECGLGCISARATEQLRVEGLDSDAQPVDSGSDQRSQLVPATGSHCRQRARLNTA